MWPPVHLLGEVTPREPLCLGPPPLTVLATGLIPSLSSPTHALHTSHLFQVEPHVMTEDVEGGLGAFTLRVVAFDPRGLEKPRVAKLVAGREGEAQPPLVPVAMKQA